MNSYGESDGSGPIVAAIGAAKYYIFFLGVFVFSSVPINLFAKIVGVQLNPVEIFAAALILPIVLGDRILVNQVQKCLSDWRFVCLGAGAFLLFMLTAFKFIEQTKSSYADLRSIMCLLVVFFVFSKRWLYRDRRFEMGYLLTLGCVAGDVFSVMLWGLPDDDAKNPMPILSSAYLVVYAIRNGDVKTLFLGVFSIAYFAVIGGFRLYYVVFALTIILIAMVSFAKFSDTSRKVRSNAGVVLFCLVVAAAASWQKVIDYWMASESRQIHSINRTMEIADDGVGRQRSGSFVYPLLNPAEFAVPNGLGVAAYYEVIQRSDIPLVSGVDGSADSMFFYAAYHAGIVGYYLLMIYLLYSLLSVFRFSGVERLCAIYAIVIVIVQAFVEAGPFYMIQRSMPWALMLAYSVSPFVPIARSNEVCS